MEKQNAKIFLIILWTSFFVLIARLFQLQVVEGKNNRFLAENNRVKKMVISAPRGLLLDRHGEVLVQNKPLFLTKDKKGGPLLISREEATTLQTQGKEVSVISKREYNFGKTFSHILGYLGQPSDEELTKGKFELKGYSVESLVGRAGIEKEYESKLKGRDGSELTEVNSLGEIIRKISRTNPEPGETLTLAVDKNLQEIAEKEMAGRRGAVIATNPQNGEVLVFYSSPSYDLAIFNDGKRTGEFMDLLKDEASRPLLNRVIGGIYPPGSTFKIVTSIAGLEEGKITPDTLINDSGVITVNEYQYANWYWTQYGRTEGEVNLVKALTRSVDTYFYKVGEYLGAENLIKWIKKFNLDEKFGIDLPAESAGFVVTPKWKEENRGEAWFLGNTYHLAIGQGDLILTPLGVNQMTSVVANGGKLCKPRVLRIGAENTPYKSECRDLGIKKENLEAVKKGMLGACSSGGTGYPFFGFTPQVACKTGTAETGDGKTTHAWFTVMAPADMPEIVLTVLVENGGEGSSVSAPIAKEILKEFFRE